MKKLFFRPGFTLLEVVLFFGILGIMSTTIVAVYIATQETRVRQHSVAALEQSGTQILDAMTRNIRRAEKILKPTTNQTGSILTLQMAGNAEYPTIFARAADGNLTLAKKTQTSALLPLGILISDIVFRNVNDTNVSYSFTLSTTIPTIPPRPYSRSFWATVTLFPDDQSEAGGCGNCSSPTCSGGRYQWNHCDNGVCTASDITIPC